jgi:HD-like signal output (HDOD) protein
VNNSSYSAGLLHDIGKVILNGMALQEGLEEPKYQGFSGAKRDIGRDISSLERQCFGSDHPSAGRDAATHWALPTEIVEAIARHHGTIDEGEQGLPAFLALANAVAGAVDPAYPATQRAPIPAHPVVPVEPLLAMGAEQLK